MDTHNHLIFFVKTLSGDIFTCEIDPTQLTPYSIYQSVWHTLPEPFKYNIHPWDILLIPDSENQDLIYSVQQSSTIFLFVQPHSLITTRIQSLLFGAIQDLDGNQYQLLKVHAGLNSDPEHHHPNVEHPWNITFIVRLGIHGELIMHHRNDIKPPAGSMSRFINRVAIEGNPLESFSELLQRDKEIFHNSSKEYPPSHILFAIFEKWEELVRQKV